jgi:hypothetical protein
MRFVKLLQTNKVNRCRLKIPRHMTANVVVQLDVFEKLQRALNYDTSEPNPREFYTAFADAVKEDLDESNTIPSNKCHDDPTR